MKLDNRNKLLLAGFLLILFLSYHLAFKNTLALRKEYIANIDKQNLSTDIPQELELWAKKEKQLDLQLKKLNLSDSFIQNNLLRFLNRYSEANEIKIVEFRVPHVFQDTDAAYKTYIFSLEGSYGKMLQIIHALEQSKDFGIVSHVAFEKKQNYRRNRAYLQALVFLKYVE